MCTRIPYLIHIHFIDMHLDTGTAAQANFIDMHLDTGTAAQANPTSINIHHDTRLIVLRVSTCTLYVHHTEVIEPIKWMFHENKT